MSQTSFPLFLLPHFLSLILSIGVVLYAWKRQNASGVQAFIWYAGGQTLWIIGFILKTLHPTLSGKLFWENFQWAVLLFSVPALPLFALQYTDKNLQRIGKVIHLPLIFSALLALIPLSNDFHRSFFIEPTLIQHAVYTELSFQASFYYYLLLAYSYCIFAWGIFLLLTRFIRTHNLYRAQTALLTIGFFFPAIGVLVDVTNTLVIPYQSSIPISIALGNLINAWNLFHLRIFKVIPVSRDQAFEAMMDPVVILDNNNTIIDVNRSMLDLLGKTSPTVIGESAKTIFDNFPIPIKLYSSVSYARTETSFTVNEKTVHYEMSVWPILNGNREVTSRLYISHDITALKELEAELRNLNNRLETRVQDRTRELADSYDYTLEGWAKALELRDKETEGHSRRVTEATLNVARAYGIPENEFAHIRRGAILHDIGKMAIPDEILLKSGGLSSEERLIIEEHPVTAYNLLKEIPYLQKALDIPYCHHERWDGSGYPRGLKGRNIPLAARIFSVVDVWDALRSERPYSPVWSAEQATAYLIENAGKLFDPKIVNIFLDLMEKGEIM